MTETANEMGAADAVKTAPAAANVEADAAAPVTSATPQVGDLTPRGVIAGVRLHSDGRCEISFDGAEWQQL